MLIRRLKTLLKPLFDPHLRLIAANLLHFPILLAPHLPILPLHVPHFTHNSVTFHKMLDVVGKSKNIDLFWETYQEIGKFGLVNDKTFMIALKTLALVRELKKCVDFFHLMNGFGVGYKLETLNTVVESLCNDKQFVTFKLKECVEPNGITYKWLIWGFQANGMFKEMCQKGIQADNLTLASIIYGLLARGRIREAYRIVEGIENPDISIYHGLIKGLLRLRKTGEATQVFREMIKRGCEPIMHTYIMLLQGHLGKKWRKRHDPLVNFDSIFVGGLIKAGKTVEATKYVERTMKRGMEVPRFDYNKFLHYHSNEEGVMMFEEVDKKLREVGLFDLADILERYGQKMATRDRRRNRAVDP
ncbi:hypothetical protein GOBAR_DD24014 [Gossypium barbadense]|nr:hypothetical protein GOBAR_DD24014 [Gossypium barbadense]